MADSRPVAFGANLKYYQHRRPSITWKSVAIIGAGPAGLIAASTLKASGPIRWNVRIFEKTSEVGGLWSVNKDRPYDGMLNPEMPTNLSRFNMGFEGYPWSSAGFDGHINYWPKAWQVSQYLKEFANGCRENIVFNSKVTYAGLERGSDQIERWRVRWRSSLEGGTHDEPEEIFDHIIVATGFFGAPIMPSFPRAEAAGIKVVHSTKLRHLRDVVPVSHTGPGTILVVGGGMSGGDSSTVLATQLSDAMHSPSGDNNYSGLKLVQLCTDRAYALPLTAPSDRTYPEAPEFLPLDLCMYKLDTRPPGDIKMNAGKVTQDFIASVHTAFQGIVGDQTSLNAQGLVYNDTLRAPYVTLTELYSGFIRSGNIKILIGRLQDVLSPEEKDSGKVRITYEYEGVQSAIDDVVGIVYATGFTPQPSLDFLAPEILQKLEHDPNHNRVPVILDEYATLTHKIPNLALIGFHEGAFWGSMQMEARLVAKRWSTTEASISGLQDPESTRADLRDLRLAMNNKDGNVPQYWMGDYVGLMEEISRQVGLQRIEFMQLGWPVRSGPVSTYRYTQIAGFLTKFVEEFSSLMKRSKNKAMFVPRAAFLGMQGHWRIDRKITSALDSMPSGTLSGGASFHPRHPTSPEFDFEFLYVESGSFRMTNGMTMQASRQYVYRYSEAEDRITVWFVKPDGKTVDYMYHGLSFDVKNRSQGWRAKADHLCIDDMYKSDYLFKFMGANVSSFQVTHAVQGPRKDYISETVYTR